MWLNRIVLRLLRKVCPVHLVEAVEGDLWQRYDRDRQQAGEGRAWWRMTWNILWFFRPAITMRRHYSASNRKSFPVGHNFRFIGRQMVRNKLFTAINITGLTLGIAVALFVVQFALFEYSFENFNANADRTFRVNLYNTSNGVFDGIDASTVPALGYAITESSPGIESIARLGYRTRTVMSTASRQFTDSEEVVFADPAIAEVLSLEFVAGKKLSEQAPGGVIISESVALKYFGRIDVVGETIDLGFNNNSLERQSHTVMGVFKDIPLQAHQRFDLLMSPNNVASWNENWSWSEVSTYVVLLPGVNPKRLDAGLAEIVKEHHLDSKGDRYLLEPIRDIRLHALNGTGRATLVNFLLLLGAVILALAWFNYVNLTTARFFERLKEIGVRKIVGAARLQLIWQVLTESYVFQMISCCCAVGLFYMTWPTVASLLGQEIPTTLFNEPVSWIILLSLLFCGAVTAGIYPALFLSSFHPFAALKGLVGKSTGQATVRKTLMVVQLSAAAILVTAVLAIQRQLNYMRKQTLGISIDQMLIIDGPLMHDATSIQRFEPFKLAVSSLPGVQGVTYASSFPGNEIDWHRTDIKLREEEAVHRYDSRIISIGTDFIHVFQLPLLAGRNLDPSNENDNKAMLLSASAVRMFGFGSMDESLGEIVFIGSRRFEVIGVVDDYHYRSLQYAIEPILYIQGYPRNPAYAIKVPTERLPELLPIIEGLWTDAYSGNVFTYNFLDDRFNEQYLNDRRVSSLIGMFTIMAAFISGAGLFGLSLYAVGRRKKEVAIRKVLGASVVRLTALLSGDAIRLMLLSALLATPLSYYGVARWLEGYAHKMEPDFMLFLAPLFLVFTLVLLAIAFQTIAAARRSPVEGMRYE
jgi:putative ABC transport system permease protein